MNRDFRPPHQPGLDRACNLERYGHTTPDIVLPDKLDPLQKDRRVLYQASGFPNRQARRGVDPKLSLKQAYPFLSGSQLEDVDLIVAPAGPPFVLEFVVRWGHGQLGFIARLSLGLGRQIAGDNVALYGLISLKTNGFVGDTAQPRDAPQRLQPPLFLQLRQTSVNFHFHRRPAQPFSLLAGNRRIRVNDGFRCWNWQASGRAKGRRQEE